MQAPLAGGGGLNKTTGYPHEFISRTSATAAPPHLYTGDLEYSRNPHLAMNVARDNHSIVSHGPRDGATMGDMSGRGEGTSATTGQHILGLDYSSSEED